MSETTPGDRVEAFLKLLPQHPVPAGSFRVLGDVTDAAGHSHPLTENDLWAILRTNRSLAEQIVRYGDRIIEASAEIQRATLRAAAAEGWQSMLDTAMRERRVVGADDFRAWLEEQSDVSNPRWRRQIT